MSSGLLYLAIVGVWAVVLVPMWVRRNDAGEARSAERGSPVTRLLGRRGAPDPDKRYIVMPPRERPVPPAAAYTPHSRRARARVMARRRRRFFGIVLLLLAAVAIAATGLAQWWIVSVPAALLVGYMACLRAAAAYDMELRQREHLVRARRSADQGSGAGRRGVGQSGPASQPWTASGTARGSRVIDLTTPGAWSEGRATERVMPDEEPFDQYADPPIRRAVGD